MNIELLNKIKTDVLLVPLEAKEYSSEFHGVYLHSNSPFSLEEHEGPIRSFRVFSQKTYPIHFFISPDAWNAEFDKLLEKYDHIYPHIIARIQNVIDFNYFSIYALPQLLSGEKLVYFQSDGFLIKSGWEDMTQDYSWLGAKWKSPVRVIEDTFNFGPVQIGNGGCNFRLRSKMLEVLDLVAKHGGQDQIVKGIEIDGVIRNRGSFLAEDLFFCYFGFGAGIFKPVDLKYIDRFAVEPVTWEQYKSDYKPFLFHRIDE